MRVDLRQTLMGWRWLIPASLVLELMMHNMCLCTRYLPVAS